MCKSASHFPDSYPVNPNELNTPPHLVILIILEVFVTQPITVTDLPPVSNRHFSLELFYSLKVPYSELAQLSTKYHFLILNK